MYYIIGKWNSKHVVSTKWVNPTPKQRLKPKHSGINLISPHQGLFCTISVFSLEQSKQAKKFTPEGQKLIRSKQNSLKCKWHVGGSIQSTCYCHVIIIIIIRLYSKGIVIRKEAGTNKQHADGLVASYAVSLTKEQ